MIQPCPFRPLDKRRAMEYSEQLPTAVYKWIDCIKQKDSGKCAVQYKGAWWYTDRHASNLNGIYHHGAHSSTLMVSTGVPEKDMSTPP